GGARGRGGGPARAVLADARPPLRRRRAAPAAGGPAWLRRGDRGTTGEGDVAGDAIRRRPGGGRLQLRGPQRGARHADAVRRRPALPRRRHGPSPARRAGGTTGMTADITSLRIATFNLLHGLDVRSNRVDLDAAAEAIDKLDADVVAVQEVDRGLA